MNPDIGLLEPSFRGGPVVHTVTIPAKGCGTFQFLYFGTDRNLLERVNSALAEIESLLALVPSVLLPDVDFPQLLTQADRNLVRWTCLVYWIAWQCDDVYLQAELEYRSKLDKGSFLPWFECPKPPLCDPCNWILLQPGFEKRIEAADRGFQESSLAWPDLIDGYLIENLIVSSATAIDLLIQQLPSTSSSTSKKKPSSKQKQALVRNTARDLWLLKGLLHARHCCGFSEQPFLQREIEDILGWSQRKVSHTIKKIFTKGGMQQYCDAFKRKDLMPGLKLLLEDGQSVIDGIVRVDDEDVDIDENGE